MVQMVEGNINKGGIMESECKGCKSYDEKEYCRFGIIQNIENTKGCPCRTCLIKVVCNDLCDEFLEYKRLSRDIYSLGHVMKEFDQKGFSFFGPYDKHRVMYDPNGKRKGY